MIKKHQISKIKMIALIISLALTCSFMAVAQVNNLTNPGSGPYASIQDAINNGATVAGDILSVSPGIYNENVIVSKEVTIRSTGGKAVTTVNGSASGPLGTFQIPANNVTIGGFGQGFTIRGYDSPNPGLEYAAVYIQGVRNNITIRGNEIVADGEAGLLTEFGNAVNNFTVNANIFSGKTFTGAMPGDCGFANQFTASNVPRQLVNIPAGLGIVFTSNNITGISGGPSAISSCITFGQGNTLVTIDASTVTIRGNNFAGTTTRFGSSLRARGTNVNINCNTFNNAGLGVASTHIVFNSGLTALSGGASPSTVAGVASANTFITEGAYFAGATQIYRSSAQVSAIPQVPIAANIAALASVTNINTGETFCSIQSAINDANTVNGHTINVGAGTYAENVVVSKSVSLRGSNTGVSACGNRGTESTLTGFFEIAANGVTINGFEITGAGAQVRSTVGLSTWSNIEISNNWIHSTTAQIPIRHGLGYGGGIGTTGWQVLNNKIDNIQFNNATAIALFNITGVDVIGNCISHTNAGFTGRRGINADGLVNTNISSNTVNMGDFSPTTQSNTIWAIQVSMSDRDAVAISILGNTVSNVYRSILSLSQRNLTGLTIRNNNLTNVSLGVDLNTGGVPPQIPQPVQSNISIDNNNIVTVTPTISGALGAGVRMRNLHCTTPGCSALTSTNGNGPVSFSNVDINENSITGTNPAAILLEAGINSTLVNATCNWYGTTDNAVIVSKNIGNVNYTPYLNNGTDNSAATGFQPLPGSCVGVPRPALTMTLNGTTINDNNDGNADVAIINVCNTTAVNLFFSGTADLNGVTASANVKVRQEFVLTNTMWVGPTPVDSDHPLSAYAGSFNRQVGLINASAPGTLLMRFRAYYDANSNNTFDAGDYEGDWMEYTVNVNPQLKLNTSINGVVVNSNNDGNDDNASFSVCNTANNILFNSFTDANGITGPLAKSYQVLMTLTNVTVPFCNNCSAALSLFTGATGSAALVNPALPGTLVMKFRGFYDANGNGQIDAGECPGDWIVYTVTVNPLPVCSITGASTVCPSSVGNTYNTTAGMSSYLWSITGAGSIVGGTNSSSVSVNAAASCNSSYTLTVTITNTNGCQTTCEKIVNVQDISLPVLSGQGSNATISCPAVPSFTAPTAADACDAAPVITFTDVIAAGSCAGTYTTTRTWTATDACGNASLTVSQAITVQDITLPVLSGQGSNATISCPAVPSFTAPTASDACDAAPVITFTDVIAAGSCAGTYTITRTWTATDACGNASLTVSQAINVQDISAPVITCKTNQVRTVNNALCTYKTTSNEFDVTAADNCSGLITFRHTLSGATTKSSTNGSLANQIFNTGVTTVTWWAKDQCGNESSCSFTVTVSSTLNATVPANVFAMNPPNGISANTIYIGYTPASVLTISATATGGTSPYTYLWTVTPNLSIVSGATASIVNVTSTTQGGALYQLTLVVTDAFGCKKTITKVVYAVNASCGNKNDKVIICHNGKEICVSPNAVPAHLTHGSLLGACQPISLRGSLPITKNEMVIDLVPGDLVVNVFPNPSHDLFTLRVNSLSNEAVNVRVMDMLGRSTGVTSRLMKGRVLQIGRGLKPGTYIAEVIQGNNRKMVQLVKVP